jgi:hypothetical protein
MLLSLSRLRFVTIFVFALLTGAVFTTAPTASAQSSIPACAVTPDMVGGQGFTVSGFGFTVSGFGFTVSGFGFTVSGFGFTVSGFNIDPLKVARDIRDNPISNQWLQELLPSISSGDGYNSVKTAILIVDDESHGDQVEAVFDHLMEVSNVSKVDVFRVDIGGSEGYQTDRIADAIENKINELKGQGYQHFAINMSFGLVPCEDAGPTFDGVRYPFNFKLALTAIAAGNQPPPPKPVIPKLECVQKLGSGKYLGRFSYDNQNEFPVTIVVGNQNEFFPASPKDRGQPVVFEPGEHRDVFAVQFPGQRVKWFLTGPDGVRREVEARSDSPACSSTRPTPNQSVRPVLECVTNNGNGTYTARFGYKNDNSVAISIPVGANNRFSPTPENRVQTNTFLSGRRRDVFRVTFSGGNLVWSLRGPDGSNRTATASTTSTPCVDDQGYGLLDYIRSINVPAQYVDDYMAYLFDKSSNDLNDLRTLLSEYLEESASSNGAFAVYPVASSGNFRPWLGAKPLAPARWDETIAVGATLGNFGDLWQFSHDGNVLAPGAGFELSPNNFIAGTSFAAPFVSTYLAHFGTYPNACTFPVVDGEARPPLVAPDALGNTKVLAGELSPFTCVPPQSEPDQFVCYADSVEYYLPGTRKDGSAVIESRRIPARALGAPQKDDSNNFVSLGFDKNNGEPREGVLILGFDNILTNGEGADVRIWETSFNDGSRSFSQYPEKALVYVSQSLDGPWTLINPGGTTDKDQAYDLVLDWAKYMKLEDITGKSGFENSADGFDVDAIEAYYCERGEGSEEHLIGLPASDTVRSANSVFANAGADIVKIDRKGKGFKKVILDASASYSTVKKIKSYEWSLPGYTIEPVAQPKVRLPIGTHSITLTVTDKQGNIAVDTITVTVHPDGGGDVMGLPPSNGRGQ